jgi:hypothetical protein
MATFLRNWAGRGKGVPSRKQAASRARRGLDCREQRGDGYVVPDARSEVRQDDPAR